MASAAVMAAVEAHVGAAWTLTIIKTPNGGGRVPKDGGPFLEIEYPVANSQQITVGAPGQNIYREQGAFRLVLSIPVGKGFQDFATQFDVLLAACRGKSFDGVSTWAPSPPVTNDNSDRGAYFEISSSCPYYFDAVG